MKIVSEGTFSDLNIDLYEIPPPPKYTETRGYMYVIKDSAYPDHIKIGRTQNVKKRLAQYNADKPYPTASLVAVSCEFADVLTVEKKILESLYKKTSPTTFSREWFTVDNTDECLYLISKAEETFECDKGD